MLNHDDLLEEYFENGWEALVAFFIFQAVEDYQTCRRIRDCFALEKIILPVINEKAIEQFKKDGYGSKLEEGRRQEVCFRVVRCQEC